MSNRGLFPEIRRALAADVRHDDPKIWEDAQLALDEIEETVRGYVVAVSRSSGNRDEDEVQEFSEALMALITYEVSAQ